MARQSVGNANGPTLARTDTQSSLSGNTNPPATSTTVTKRQASPDHRKREESRSGDYGPSSHKRSRPMSPVRDRDRERWDGPRRRFASPPPWERDRDRDGPPPPPRRMDRERDDEKIVSIPTVISWFVGQLPAPAVFDGEF
jgi:cleavage stimulation factor subunit 3